MLDIPPETITEVVDAIELAEDIPPETITEVADAIEIAEKLSCQSRLNWKSFWRDKDEEEAFWADETTLNLGNSIIGFKRSNEKLFPFPC